MNLKIYLTVYFRQLHLTNTHTTLTGKIELDYTWIEALAEMTGRQCSEDEKLLILSSFSNKFNHIEQSHDDFMNRCRREIGLSPRLTDVLDCLMDSFSNKEIAKKLGISPHTAKDYVKHVLNHYMVSSKRELLAAIKMVDS